MKEKENIGNFIVTNRERALNYMRKAFTSLAYEDLEDIYQEASIALIMNEQAGKIDNLTCDLYTYFLRICINLSLKQIKHMQKTTFVYIEKQQSVLYDVEKELQENEESCAIIEMRNHLVEETLEGLSDQSQRLLIGFYVEDKNWTTVADSCGLASANSAKSLAYRCRQQFRKRYQFLAAQAV